MRRQAKGFTLLEVVAAIAILALSSVVLMKALGASMALASGAVAHTQAAAWAQSKLDSVFVMDPPTSGVTQGTFDSRYRWRLTVAPWQPPRTGSVRDARGAEPGAGSRLRLYKLDLAVMWGPTGRVHVAHFDTLRIARAQSPGPSP